MKDGKGHFYEVMLIEQMPDGLVLRLKHFNAGLIGWEDKVHYQAGESFGVSLIRNGKKALLEEGAKQAIKNQVEVLIKGCWMNSDRYPGYATKAKLLDKWNLAEAYLKAGDMKSAKRYCEKSLKLNPKNESARENLRKIKEVARK